MPSPSTNPSSECIVTLSDNSTDPVFKQTQNTIIEAISYSHLYEEQAPESVLSKSLYENSLLCTTLNSGGESHKESYNYKESPKKRNKILAVSDDDGENVPKDETTDDDNVSASSDSSQTETEMPKRVKFLSNEIGQSENKSSNKLISRTVPVEMDSQYMKLFHSQLSTLTESKSDVSHIKEEELLSIISNVVGEYSCILYILFSLK